MRFLLFLLLLATAAFAAPTPPNIVLVLIDDMGQTDAGCYGSKFYQTPNIDRLAQEGMRFTQAYSACTVCSPTRCALMTGRTPAALHITDWISGHKRPFAKLNVPDWCMELPAEEETLATALHRTGYVCEHIGKWHLGQQLATAHGFDFTVADNGKGSPARYLSPYKNPNLSDGPPGEHLSDRLTDEALKFIDANREHPFFLYLAHYAVHTPLSGKPEVIAKYKARVQPDDRQDNPVYGSLVESIDDSVGRLRARLAELKLADHTVFVFTSDNGGLLSSTYNIGLRAGKGSAYEGGVRIPLIVDWPGVTKPGSVSPAQVISYDFFPTLLEAAGGHTEKVLEGQSLVPLFKGGTLPERPLFWHYPHYHPGGATPYSAVRLGDWKLIEFFEDGRRELYHLSEDPLERQNLAAAEPQRVEALWAQLDAWRKRVGAQFPTPNPKWDAAKDLEAQKKAGNKAEP